MPGSTKELLVLMLDKPLPRITTWPHTQRSVVRDQRSTTNNQQPAPLCCSLAPWRSPTSPTTHSHHFRSCPRAPVAHLVLCRHAHTACCSRRAETRDGLRMAVDDPGAGQGDWQAQPQEREVRDSSLTTRRCGPFTLVHFVRAALQWVIPLRRLKPREHDSIKYTTPAQERMMFKHQIIDSRLARNYSPSTAFCLLRARHTHEPASHGRYFSSEPL